MRDVEEVIAAYECSLNVKSKEECLQCPYDNQLIFALDESRYCFCDKMGLLEDAIEILKQKIPARVGYSFDGDLICGSCHYILDKKYDTCPKCGRGLRW